MKKVIILFFVFLGLNFWGMGQVEEVPVNNSFNNTELLEIVTDEDFNCTIPCPMISTKTFKRPDRKTRTTIGVKEEVKIKLKNNKSNKCGIPVWSVVPNNIGTLQMITNEEYMFTAGLDAGMATITITFPPGNNCEDVCGVGYTAIVVFTIVEPTGISFVNTDKYLNVSGGSSVYCGHYIHAKNRPSSGFYAKNYILSDNVNFYNIVTRELFAAPITNGAYPLAVTNEGIAIPNHDANNWIGNTSKITNGLGTKALRLDNIWFEGPCPPPSGNVPANLDGTFTYNIQWQYASMGGQDMKNLVVVSQIHTNTGANLTFSSVKGNASSSHILSASSTKLQCLPTTPCD